MSDQVATIYGYPHPEGIAFFRRDAEQHPDEVAVIIAEWLLRERELAEWRARLERR